MASLMSTRHLYQALKDQGFAVPENCREASVVMAPDSAFVIRYEVFLTDADLIKLGKALKQMGEKS